EDARNRATRAAETTKFLEQEVNRLQGALTSIGTQITEITLKPPDPKTAPPDQLKEQRAELARLKLELIQKSATYSSAHPEVTTRHKRIAVLEKLIAATPAAAASEPDAQPNNSVELLNLKHQLASTQAALEEANRKLSAARLGESMER